jgi:hypothetical protein
MLIGDYDSAGSSLRASLCVTTGLLLLSCAAHELRVRGKVWVSSPVQWRPRYALCSLIWADLRGGGSIFTYAAVADYRLDCRSFC